MDVYVIGMDVHDPSDRVADKRLEEMVFDTARGALDDAGVSRDEIDHVTIAACDELDGRSISSMLLATPAGAYLKDELKCTDSGLTGFCLAAMRAGSGVFHLGLVSSWNKSSVAPVEEVMNSRCEPFFTRPIGLNMSITDGLFAQTVADIYGIDEDDVNRAVMEGYRRAHKNPRGMQRQVPTAHEISNSPHLAYPLRKSHQAPITDGAVSMVLASGEWVAEHPNCRPLARIAGMGWRTEGYSLGRDRLGALTGFRDTFEDALGMAGLLDADELDVIELDSQTGYHELAFKSALGVEGLDAVSPSGGVFAQNPYFCTGMTNAAEAILQVNGLAGPTQVQGAHIAAAHQSHGFAQQGHVAVIFEGV